MGESQRAARFHPARHIIRPDCRLIFVRRQNHHEIGPFGSLCIGHHREACIFRLLARGRRFPQGDGDILDTAISQILRMGMALTAIADDGDFLARDQIEIGIGVVIDFHGGSILVFFIGVV